MGFISFRKMSGFWDVDLSAQNSVCDRFRLVFTLQTFASKGLVQKSAVVCASALWNMAIISTLGSSSNGLQTACVLQN